MMDRRSGFTIVELAVVLTIISLIVAASLSFGTARLAAAKLQSTKDKMTIIMDTLRDYVRTNGHLPCPADPIFATGNANFGVGTGTGATDPGACTAVNLLDPGGGSNVRAGAVPTRNLGLPPEFAMDGWGRRFLYVMDQQYTNSIPANFWDAGPCANPPGTSCTNQSGEITVQTLGGGSTIADGTTANPPPAGAALGAVVLVMSYGPNGLGAYTGEQDGVAATRIDCTGETDGDALENCDNGGFNVTFRTSPVPTSTFDDLVQYRLKWNLCLWYANAAGSCNP